LRAAVPRRNLDVTSADFGKLRRPDERPPTPKAR
jgi:hypothetical protein